MKTLTLILLSLALAAQAQNAMTLVAQFEGEGVDNYFGQGMTMGDFDADGMEEFVIGALGWYQDRGRNYFYQYDSGWPTAPYMTLQGLEENISYDLFDANLSDINGDGLDDLGIPIYGYGPETYGRLDIFFGGLDFDTIPEWSMTAEMVQTFAAQLDSCGDVNGDGQNDIVMQTFYYGDPAYMERLQIYHGGTALDSVVDWTKFVPLSRSSALGDVNADGFADIMVLGGNQEPVQIYYGGNPMDTIPDLIFEEYAYQAMGGGVGDVNADGYPDFLLFMHFPDSTFGNDAVYFGGPDVDDVPDVYLLKWTGGSNGSIHGVCGGDFNDDGISDIVSASGIPAYGPVIEIYLGGPWFNPTPDALITSWDYYTYSGLTAAMATGDVNGDGRDELLISAITGVYFDIGRAYLFKGPETWTDLGAGVEPEELVRYPGWFKLDQNYPNPFNSTTSIHFELGKPSTVNLKIYDIQGNEIKQLVVDKEMLPGGYNVSWNSKNEHNQAVSSGIYLLELQVDQYRQMKKMVLVR
jgi:hypothetical protein